MSLNITLNSSTLARLGNGEETCITGNTIGSQSPNVKVSSYFYEKCQNVHYYFAANGDTSLFDFLVAGQYLKIHKNSSWQLVGGVTPIWSTSFSINYSVSSSDMNSLANKRLLDKTMTVYGYTYSGSRAYYHSTDGEIIPEIYTGPSYYNTYIRFDIQVPKTVTPRSTVGGSIDCIFVYTYTT